MIGYRDRSVETAASQSSHEGVTCVVKAKTVRDQGRQLRSELETPMRRGGLSDRRKLTLRLNALGVLNRPTRSRARHGHVTSARRTPPPKALENYRNTYCRVKF